MAAERKYPWPKPEGGNEFYQSNGPTSRVEFNLEGHQLEVAPIGAFGLHTGRMRFRVKCLTCNKELHEGTTGPSSHIDSHLDQK